MQHIHDLQALTPNKTAADIELKRNGVPGWIRVWINSHVQNLHSALLLEALEMLTRFPHRGNPFFVPNLPQRNFHQGENFSKEFGTVVDNQINELAGEMARQQ